MIFFCRANFCHPNQTKPTLPKNATLERQSMYLSIAMQSSLFVCNEYKYEAGRIVGEGGQGVRLMDFQSCESATNYRLVRVERMRE